MTRYGLRPRHAANTLAVIVCSDAGFRVEYLLAQCKKTYFGAVTTFTCVMADHSPFLELCISRCLNTHQVQFWPGGYRYTIYTGQLRPIRQIRFCWHIPGPLSVEAMNVAAQHLVGTRDFRSFAAAVYEDQNAVRTVFRCNVTRGFNGDPDTLSIDIEGDGFLRHMVRILVGTLVDISHGHWRPEEIVDILEARDRSAAGHLAPASGLCLEWIQYRGQAGVEA